MSQSHNVLHSLHTIELLYIKMVDALIKAKTVWEESSAEQILAPCKVSMWHIH